MIKKNLTLLSRKLIEKLGYGEQLGEFDEPGSDIDENNQDEVGTRRGRTRDQITKKMILQKIVKQMTENRNKVQVLMLTLKIV